LWKGLIHLHSFFLFFSFLSFKIYQYKKICKTFCISTLLHLDTLHFNHITFRYVAFQPYCFLNVLHFDSLNFNHIVIRYVAFQLCCIWHVLHAMLCLRYVAILVTLCFRIDDFQTMHLNRYFSAILRVRSVAFQYVAFQSQWSSLYSLAKF
jgi:hypothetical protein